MYENQAIKSLTVDVARCLECDGAELAAFHDVAHAAVVRPEASAELVTARPAACAALGETARVVGLDTGYSVGAHVCGQVNKARSRAKKATGRE